MWFIEIKSLVPTWQPPWGSSAHTELFFVTVCHCVAEDYKHKASENGFALKKLNIYMYLV